MKRQKKQAKQEVKKTGINKKLLTIILFFAGACLITMFIFAYLVLKHIM